ncbi:blood group Rh(CE) polypeptide [Pterocles gutturalis]|uniref:Blood group Rh(D) polypeptide n=1 Tax=Pterocles gutturalis TaxID=240206 RepID=A0AAW3DGV9_9AVES|nr:PREDICTED: blood group Rh(CE) polypeptide [Pterocles gutturalis]KFU97767.1 Blood group Rh(D) polypeptide [Pterocles gutturalis]
MSSSYRNFRNNVPWLILFLEAVFLGLFYFLFSDGGASRSSISYAAFQDVNHMVIFGFGFFLTFLRRYGFSSTGFNLLIIVLGVQCSLLTEGLLVFLLQRAREDGLKRLTKATLSMTAVVISTGAVLGKTNPVQLILMTVVETLVFQMSRFVNSTFLQVPDNIGMMHVHLFGAYFGLAVSSRFSEPPPRSEKNASTPKSDLFSMLGTLFLWVFWPSFNSVLAEDNKSKVIYNTYFALAASAVTAFVLSALTAKDGKFRMSHIHSAVLAGGVAVGYAAHRIEYPWIAMILGLLASVITVLGSYCLQRCLNPALKIHDASGVHFTFGLPGVLGALAQVVLLVIKNWADLSSLDYLVLVHIGAFCLTISVALITGFITGLILNLRLFKTTPVSKYFDDQFYWEFPHLAVGF